MRFKLDENLGRRGGELLAAASHDVMTVKEQNLLGSPDNEIVRVCADEDRCLITLDADFANVLSYPPDQYAGIVVLRLPRLLKLHDIEIAINTLIDAIRTLDTLRGKLWIVRQGRVREFSPF